MAKILVLDIETTNFLGKDGKIVEVGAVELCLETGATKVVYDKVCKEPGLVAKDRDAWIFKNSSLTPERVRDSKDFDLEEIQKIVDAYPEGCTAYNNQFDFSFLQNRGLVIPKQLACPMKLATPICKLKGKYGFKYPSVEEAWAFFFPDEPYTEKHRGADDALHEAKIIYKLYQMGVFKI